MNLVEAIRESNMEEFKKNLAQCHPDTFILNGDRMLSPLMFAVEKKNSEFVQMLIKAGVDVNLQRSDDGVNALMCAVYNGYNHIMDILLGAGANPNASTIDGYTPIMIASCKGNVDAIKLLINAGANVNSTTADSRTALIMAAKYGYMQIVTILMHAGAEVNHHDNQKISALFFAAVLGHIEIVQALLSAGATFKYDLIMQINNFSNKEHNYHAIRVLLFCYFDAPYRREISRNLQREQRFALDVRAKVIAVNNIILGNQNTGQISALESLTRHRIPGVFEIVRSYMATTHLEMYQFLYVPNL